MNFQCSNIKNGFSLIEVIVAITLFTVVVAITSGTTLSLIGGSRLAQQSQELNKNVEIVMGDLVRNVRSGSNYICGTFDDTVTHKDCGAADSKEFYFKTRFDEWVGYQKSGGNFNIRYIYENPNNPDNTFDVTKRVFDSDITVKEFLVDVRGSDPSDEQQPTVSIYARFEQTDPRSGVEQVSIFQTTVTQRQLDLTPTDYLNG